MGFGIAGVTPDDITLELSAGNLKIKDGGVDTAQLADDAVTGAKAASYFVDTPVLASGTIIYDDFSDGRFDEARIVTFPKESGATKVARFLLPPVWVVSTGSFSVSGGKLTRSGAGNSICSTPFSTHNGGMQVKGTITYTGGGGNITFAKKQDANNLLQVVINNDGGKNAFYRKIQAGAGTNFVSTTWAGDSNEHTYKAVKDGSNHEFFIDGVSKGTATDAFAPSVVEFELNALTVTASYDGVRVDDAAF